MPNFGEEIKQFRMTTVNSINDDLEIPSEEKTLSSIANQKGEIVDVRI